jgi:ABC-type lipoprotein export system ATPase subunit
MYWGVQLNGVTFGWPDKPIADKMDIGFDFGLFSGRLPIIGPSGIGKSTLLYILSGLMNPSSGTVSWRFPDGEVYAWSAEGRSVRDMRGERAHLRHGRFSFSFQEDALLPYLTVQENLLYPLEIHASRTGTTLAGSSERIAAILDDVLNDGDGGAAEIAARYPNQLSGGQRRRIALAQAMITDPTVLFADEPCGGLDPDTRREVMQVVDDWIDNATPRGSRAFVWVTHHRDEDEFDKAPWMVELSFVKRPVGEKRQPDELPKVVFALRKRQEITGPPRRGGAAASNELSWR